MICTWYSWCHCHPIISCSSKIQNGLPFWCQLTQVVLGKGSLNGCSSSSSSALPLFIQLNKHYHKTHRIIKQVIRYLYRLWCWNLRSSTKGEIPFLHASEGISRKDNARPLAAVNPHQCSYAIGWVIGRTSDPQNNLCHLSATTSIGSLLVQRLLWATQL